MTIILKRSKNVSMHADDLKYHVKKRPIVSVIVIIIQSSTERQLIKNVSSRTRIFMEKDYGRKQKFTS